MSQSCPDAHHDVNYVRPIHARYVDPVDIIWLSTAHELGLTIRRHPEVFGMTEGDGILHLGDRDSLDPDDSVLQMVLHEICHWITNGIDAYDKRDWGFEMDSGIDPREHACQRLQCHLADSVGLRDMLGATGEFRQYWDRIPKDPTEPMDGSAWEAAVCEIAEAAITRAHKPPFFGPLSKALHTTAAIRLQLRPFLNHYKSETKDDALPTLWHAQVEKI